ncbi:hypothetical protein, partial [Phocaeicola plebeius]|uniref:hypothetical protein n=1 Tax=Phocaeicola plebeius TaxID=310297 RepID=UPI001C7136A1
LSGINLQTDNYFQYTSVLMQTSLRFISNVLAFEIKRKGVFSSAFFTLLFMLELCPYKDFLITCN